MGNARKIEFERRHLVAAGGMATLTLVVQKDGAPLVLRELQPKLQWSPWMHVRFLRGAKIRDAVSPHPHIVYSAEYGYHGLRPYELIEYCPGANLNELIMRKDERIRKSSLEILRQACAALAHMHTRGYIHLDVKAENIIVQETQDDSVSVKLTDFDLSRPCTSHHDFSRAGTANYMSPEMLRCGTVGVESDIFAFGVMAYYCMTGRKPFSGFTLAEMRRQQMSAVATVPEPSKLNHDISPKLSWIITRCLEKNPEQRFPSMNYLQQEFSRV